MRHRSRPGHRAVPAVRPAQPDGHSRLAVTLEIYTHEDRDAQREALSRISDALGRAETPEGA